MLVSVYTYQNATLLVIAVAAHLCKNNTPPVILQLIMENVVHDGSIFLTFPQLT